ncbi:MAG: hypothetical protein KDC12_13460, partial [Flavobacteriales bacterium]|nr:hypothetical protein [Flavobacteriales bacterium]
LDKRNMCDSALMYNRDALRIFLELQNEFHRSQVLYSMGKNHICLGNLDSAEFFLQQAEILAKEKENVFTLRNISEQYIKVFKERQDWRKAYEASHQLRIYEDSLFSMEKAEAIFEIKEKFESEQKNRLIAEQNAALASQNEDLAKSELENSQKNFWILLMAGGVLGTIFLLFLGYRRAQQKQELLIREKEIKVKEEKLRISKELHDNIGARLSHIISSLEIRLFRNKEDDEIAAISVFAKDTMNQLREAIWAVSSKAIFYSELKQRVERYIEQVDAIATCGISCINSCNADFELSSTQTINMFRIIQEGVNNALKYSAASQIIVRFENNEHQVIVSISDNGCGFDPEQSSKLGSGLKGMKSRAEEIGVELSINSSAESGTRITMTLGYQ